MKKLLFLFGFISLLEAAPRTQIHMGTLISVQVDDENLSDAVFELFRDLDKRLSTYKSDSEISRLSAKGDLIVDPTTTEVLKRSLEISALTDGAFDITIGVLTHGLYGFGTAEHIPSSNEIAKKLPKVNYKHLLLKGNHAHIESNTTIDLGGIAKGYAVDLSLALLERHGIKKGVIAASGDIGCLGACVIDIQDPFHQQGKIATVSSTLSRFAISTSGNYERYIKNKKNNHLIDPRTGKPEQKYASITLIDSTDNTRLDALATAVSVMEETKAIKLLDSLKIGYILIYNDGRIIKSMLSEGITLK
ncbi:MAG: FAD:protein FMN transferase [Sulfuricurvum sp.]|nr:FAD:protein FMN transferase [Sulfuricurvum sp.]